MSSKQEKSYEFYKDFYEKRMDAMRKYVDTNRDKLRQKMRDYYKTPKGKIYYRVAAYNKSHPDKVTITPLEAAEMYELTGFIPQFIKHSDL